MEYSVEGAADKYRSWGLEFGQERHGVFYRLPMTRMVMVGRMLPESGERVDGMFRLKFRKFKKANEEESGKKLWQFIGKGSTTEDDYYIWSDYLSYNRMENCLELIKRVDEREVFLPGQRGSDSPHLFPRCEFIEVVD